MKELELKTPVYFNSDFYHRTHKNVPINFKDNPFIERLYCDNSENIVVMKSTQCGVTEFLIAYSITMASKSRSIFYILPTYELMIRFVNNRFNKTVMFTPLYTKFNREEESANRSMRLQNFSKGTVAFGGSNTPNVFVEFPADDVIIDELDRCDQANILMAEERQGASLEPRSIRVSNPTLPGFGISKLFNRSSKLFWHIKCESCNKLIKPDFFNHVIRYVDQQNWGVVDSKFDGEDPRSEPRMMCDCGKPLDRRGGGRWLAEGQGITQGYHISKLFSSQTTLRYMIDKYDEANGDPTLMQRFYNSELGLPYLNEGDKINQSDLDRCVRDYNQFENITEGATVMGIDVGKVMHVIIAKVVNKEQLQVIKICEVRELQDLVNLVNTFRVRMSVIDALPETRISKQFAKYRGGGHYGFMSIYTAGINETVRPKDRIVNNNRTVTLDRIKGALTLEHVHLPKEASNIPRFYDQMTASVRVYNDKKDSYSWEESGAADHYMHAFGYMLLAHKILMIGAR